jgi:hypothetical protein
MVTLTRRILTSALGRQTSEKTMRGLSWGLTAVLLAGAFGCSEETQTVSDHCVPGSAGDAYCQQKIGGCSTCGTDEKCSESGCGGCDACEANQRCNFREECVPANVFAGIESCLAEPLACMGKFYGPVNCDWQPVGWLVVRRPDGAMYEYTDEIMFEAYPKGCNDSCFALAGDITHGMNFGYGESEPGILVQGIQILTDGSARVPCPDGSVQIVSDFLEYAPPWQDILLDVQCETSRMQMTCTQDPNCCPDGTTCEAVEGPFGVDMLCLTSRPCVFCGMENTGCEPDEMCQDLRGVCVKTESADDLHTGSESLP